MHYFLESFLNLFMGNIHFIQEFVLIGNFMNNSILLSFSSHFNTENSIKYAILELPRVL